MSVARSIDGLARSLDALAGLLEKAAAHATAAGWKDEALLQQRLYPDMFPLSRQVQLACDFAARGAARLASAPLPSFPDDETTLGALAGRARAARDFLRSLDPDVLDGAVARSVTFPMRGGEVTMTGTEYLDRFVTPNHYFHMATAYNLLRTNGVPLGKTDFIGVAAPAT